jgi:hypothetical protein
MYSDETATATLNLFYIATGTKTKTNVNNTKIMKTQPAAKSAN